MSFKVQIKDYQIIKKASLEFIPGLNVIVGPSNNGKSSILKAIKSLLYTVPGTTSIRFGASSYTVGISYNGHTVLLQKGSKEAVYMVDGEKYTKFGTTTPEPVINSTNIKELTLNGNKEHLNFWEQMEYPFLLDRSPVELFRFIVDSGDDDQITKALKTMVTDRQQISRDIDQMQGSINTVDTEIVLNTDMDVHFPSIQSSEADGLSPYRMCKLRRRAIKSPQVSDTVFSAVTFLICCAGTKSVSSIPGSFCLAEIWEHNLYP